MNGMPMRLLFVLALACIAGLAGCGGNDSAADGGTTDADTDTGTDTVADAGFMPDPQRIYDDIAVLTSDEYGGRFAGSGSGVKALEFVEARFEELGLEPGFDDGYTQPFTFDVWLPGTSELVVGSTTLTESSQYAPFTWSGSGTATAEIVFVG
ncbi:MAG: hypothetical protein PHU25_19710, partial [Deltaproteobacteria bacterium]|nr:hypothetical protein [Deltaproteobacteria bacterium]